MAEPPTGIAMAREIAEMPEAARRLLARTDVFAETVERMCTLGKRRQERGIIEQERGISEMDSHNDWLRNVSTSRPLSKRDSLQERLPYRCLGRCFRKPDSKLTHS
jgi:hypothetical protein